MTIKGWKDGSYLHFCREFDETSGPERTRTKCRKFLRFDLKDNTFYRTLKSGRIKEVPEASVASFFRGLSIEQIANGFEDQEYAELIRVTDRHKASDRMRNFATIFSTIEQHQHYESYLLLGIRFAQGAFSRPVSQFPKEVQRFMRESQIIFGHNWEKNFQQYPELIANLCAHVRRCYHMDLEVYRMLESIVCSWNDMTQKFCLLITPVSETLETNDWRNRYRAHGFGCEYKALFDYIVRIGRTEAQETDSVLEEYHDYLKMMREIEQKKAAARILEENPHADVRNMGFVGYGRVEKYPNNLRVRHAIVTKNYNDFNEEYDEITFAACVDPNYGYAWSKYKMVVPRKSSDIKNEGTTLHHCVASYIERVLDGTTQIVFMRENVDEPFITVEIRSNKIVQARGYNNRTLTNEENKWLETYAKAKNIEYGKAKYDKDKPSPTPLKEEKEELQEEVA